MSILNWIFPNDILIFFWFQDQEISTLACSPNASNCVVAMTKKSTGESSFMLYDIKTMALEHNLSEGAPISELTACVFNHNSQVRTHECVCLPLKLCLL